MYHETREEVNILSAAVRRLVRVAGSSGGMRWYSTLNSFLALDYGKDGLLASLTESISLVCPIMEIGQGSSTFTTVFTQP